MNNLNKRCFATVGSTSFDDLIYALLTTDVIRILKEKGFSTLVLQIGAGHIKELMDEEKQPFVKNGIQIEYFRYKPTIAEEMKSADLIIGHAGAGTCIESLKLGKKLIVVINEKLMDNHQSELAEKLAEMGYVLYSTPSNLAEVLKSDKMLHLKSFDNIDRGDFSTFLDKKLGLKIN